MSLQPIIGLEIHVQLKTKSKMFCGCDNKGEEMPPNTTICQICTGQPGVLPVMNKQAVEWTIKSGIALNCKIPSISKFDRKNYFYPDLPKGYQISQYDQPIAKEGFLEIENDTMTHTIRMRRIHLEEDAAKNFHSSDKKYTYIDYNRAGTPLMEIVTEPDIHSPQIAKIFLQELRLIMRYLNISEADMEKGHLRCDANISLRIPNKDEFLTTPIVEIKNMNSFRAVERALEFEIKRQQKEYDQTHVTCKMAPKTTRGWDEDEGTTKEQRTKEEAHDYRYHPEPDLPPLHFSSNQKGLWNLQEIQASIPELPEAKRKRFEKEFAINKTDAKILVSDKDLADFTEHVISELEEWVSSLPDMEGVTDEILKQARHKAVKIAINWLINKFNALLLKNNAQVSTYKITPENFAEFITLIYQNKFNSTIAQKILEIMYETGKDPCAILEEKNFSGYATTRDLDTIIKHVFNENKDAIENYKKGKNNAIMYIVGQVMKEVKGKADPKNLKKIIEEKLKS